ncbi:MAG: histidine phosphatase family protein [Alphaproteobacteria bacterium]|nr:histidine phosphatase family protein [Alphaproteobacteria bacterium]
MTTLPNKPFYMMRHGETVANAEGYAAGSFDTPLTEKGRAQALAARDGFEALSPRPALIVHSNLSRARETASIINERLQIPMIEKASMAEQCFGDWKGLSWSTIHERIMAGETPPNGESMEMLTDRVIAGLSDILSMPEEPILIATHGGVFDALLWHFGCKLDDVKNCHLYEFAPSHPDAAFPWEIWHHDLSGIETPTRSRVAIYDL